MKIKSAIPNLLTLANLVCGAIVVVSVAREGFANAMVILLFVAGLFDLMDGAIARALKVSGEMGKQLDSLADVISFGLAPSIIAFSLLESTLPYSLQGIKYFAFINVACAAWRLAKFNLSTDQTHDFSGMPSPANGLFWASLALIGWQIDFSITTIAQPGLWQLSLLLLLLTSFLMVSSLRMFSFKFKPGGFRANPIAYSYIGLVLIIAITTFFMDLPIAVAVATALMMYMVLSVFYHFSLRSQ